MVKEKTIKEIEQLKKYMFWDLMISGVSVVYLFFFAITATTEAYWLLFIGLILLCLLFQLV